MVRVKAGVDDQVCEREEEGRDAAGVGGKAVLVRLGELGVALGIRTAHEQLVEH